MTLEQLHERMLALPPEVRATPVLMFAAVLDLYEGERISGTALDEDGDMLLFQWGSYDWGEGQFFELDLTRQAIPAGEEDPPILQLHCTYRYPPALFAGIASGNRWCANPAGLEDFRKFVLESEPLGQAAQRVHLSCSVELEDAE